MYESNPVSLFVTFSGLIMNKSYKNWQGSKRYTGDGHRPLHAKPRAEAITKYEHFYENEDW